MKKFGLLRFYSLITSAKKDFSSLSVRNRSLKRFVGFAGERLCMPFRQSLHSPTDFSNGENYTGEVGMDSDCSYTLCISCSFHQGIDSGGPTGSLLS